MALVAPNICRYTIVGSLAGQDCMNVLDARILNDGGGERETEIVRVAGDLLNQWDDHVLPLVANDYTAESIRWVDLSTASGSTGSRSSTDENTWPKSGSGAADPLPNNVYAKVVKNLEGKNRIQRNGALRLGGLLEGYTSSVAPNTLNLADRQAIDTAFEALKDGINGLGPTGEVNLVVTHTVNGAYTGFSEIATFSCAPTVGTLRRRMPGYGQ